MLLQDIVALLGFGVWGMEVFSESLFKGGFLLMSVGSGVWVFSQASPERSFLPTKTIDLEAVNAEAVEQAAAKMRTPGATKGKRAFDILCSLIVIVFFAPLFLLTALAVKLDSSGPVFYRQERVGLDGKRFFIWKFRSMVRNAERDGPQYAARGDHRVTRVGRLIRKTRIDEIPQIINVLRGEMSFVGPRPERPKFVSEFSEKIPHYSYRHLAMPGITGWAQVNHEYTADAEGARQKLEYDLFFISNHSVLLEAWVLLKTIHVVLFGVGSR